MGDQRHRIVIVGTGLVGSTFAYTLLLRELAEEIVLIDKNRAKAEGDALDLNHGIPLARPARIWAGDYPDCAGADIVVIAAGVAQRPGETRIDLLRRNVDVLREVLGHVVRHTERAILLVATNPVDVLSYAAWKLSGFPPERVIGSGTLLDSARFRYMIGTRLGVDPRSVHAYIVGEHGDTEVPVWSLATVGGVPVAAQTARDGTAGLPGGGLGPEEREAVFVSVRDAAYHIIAAKGATYYAIALALERICRSILRDERSVLTVSTLVRGEYGIDDVYLGLPAIVGRAGVEGRVHLPLAEDEVAALRRSAETLKGLIRSLAL
ncbi:L-lactate dehydrogenase [Caldinitratiruptor microaerophilus]|uniref:L-lactate dehydrogenase n=1 Tax=Caldinitratiruptor microaerophilus TaxID=671077 RepID=A0AA35CN08_9FIRM|nr:L-lactate dehydrogenase [Caldinitratiruptor microaerophilus]BDG62310.1 L-lactate dehydrogenase 2 [Caldinitratiruptor microaerophilus]